MRAELWGSRDPVGRPHERAPRRALAAAALVLLELACAVALRPRSPAASEEGGGDGGWRGDVPKCPIPTLPTPPDAACARFFSPAERRPCTVGNHTALCVDFPERPLTLPAYERAWAKSHPRTARVQIVNGEVFLVPRAENIACVKPPWVMASRLLNMLRTASSTSRDIHVPILSQLPDVDLLIATFDGSPPWPTIALNNPADRPHFERTYIVPTHRGLDGMRPPQTSRIGCEPLTEADYRTWAGKLDTLVFRGSSTGPRVDTAGWRANARARLAVLSYMFPEWVDASLTRQDRSNASEAETLTRFLGPARYLPGRSYRKYKFIMDIDGSVQANRFPGLILRGSVVLQSTQFEVPLTASLHRLAHVYSVRPDLSELLPALACLRAHSNVTLARVKHGMATASVLLSERNLIAGYYADQLQHYSRMQRFRVSRHPDAIPIKRFGWWATGADGDAVLSKGANATPVVRRLSTDEDGKRCDAGVYLRKVDGEIRD